MHQRFSALAAISALLAVCGFAMWPKSPNATIASLAPEPSSIEAPLRGGSSASAESQPRPASRRGIRNGPTLSPHQQRILATYRAKTHAKNAAQLYRHAFRSSAKWNAAAPKNPEDALRALIRGLPGSGDIIYRLPTLHEREIHDAASFLALEGDALLTIPDAALSELEREIRRRENSCKYGACGDCLPGADPKTSPQFRAVTTLIPHTEVP